ncbi:hypothetical protein I3843_03G078300 [Carya illinoinensis]|uniref:Uncharacterized protein n=1 Tax=Carya illinoinensis TaxID=32201 RepID=A0A8T1R0C6_CARIL|nr:uncharacterized protein LOC122303018 isoform X1 [Carya illinoinensis]KAG2715433.1 hypothetical protein I3760_03G075700 [Carya illinoinensis]KAG6660125.1 hypothetical protein CIPAW_03G083500 [Carya illinoinensis]KAG6720794.1 hypothetical protein I3842_03G078500 [Carya illinoinensis]KAG7986428.1 hypothetical protein I3843_03G078300 [Carya illinoinensis]
MENITASELAGFGVGTLLVCVTIAAPRIDAFISASQRSSLGMCKRCGNLKMIACTKCKGVGVVRGGPFGFNLDHELYQLLGSGGSKEQSIPCTKCQARGHFSCPDCCKI